MNKSELIDKIAAKTELSKKDTGLVLDSLIEVVTDTLGKGEEVVLTGFGTFSITERQARTGVNPRTLEKIQIAATKTPKFKAGTKLKEAVK